MTEIRIEIFPDGHFEVEETDRRRGLPAVAAIGRMPDNGNGERLLSLKASMRRRNTAEALFPDNGLWPAVELAKRRETWQLFSATGQKRGNPWSIVEQLATVMAEPVEWVEQVLLEAAGSKSNR